MFAQSPDDTGRRLWAQRFGNDVGIEQVLQGLQLDVAARSRIPGTFQMFRRVDGKIREINRLRKFFIRINEVAATGNDPFEGLIPDQDCYRFATPCKLYRLAVFHLSDQPGQAAVRLRDRMSLVHLATLRAHDHVNHSDSDRLRNHDIANAPNPGTCWTGFRLDLPDSKVQT